MDRSIRCGFVVGSLWIHCGFAMRLLWVRCGFAVGSLWVPGIDQSIHISVDRSIYPRPAIDDRTGPENLEVERRPALAIRCGFAVGLLWVRCGLAGEQHQG